MADSANPNAVAKTLKEQYVPLEQRASQNISVVPYLKDWAAIIGLTAVGGVIGRFAGKALEAKNIKLGQLASWKFGTDRVDRWSGMIMGAEVGGIYGLFRHWRKVEAKHLGVKNISSDLKTAMDPAQLEKESKKEEAFLEDLKKLDEKLAEPKSHGADINARRDASQEAGRDA